MQFIRHRWSPWYRTYEPHPSRLGLWLHIRMCLNYGHVQKDYRALAPEDTTA